MLASSLSAKADKSPNSVTISSNMLRCLLTMRPAVIAASASDNLQWVPLSLTTAVNTTVIKTPMMMTMINYNNNNKIIIMLLFNWLGTSRWQEQGRWSHTDSFEGGQVLDVGCDNCLHHGWLLHRSCHAGSWLCGGDASLSQRGKICHFAESLWFPADCIRDPESYQWVGHFEFRLSAGRTNRQSLSFCFSAFRSPSSTLTRFFYATVSCCPTTRISVCSRL